MSSVSKTQLWLNDIRVIWKKNVMIKLDIHKEKAKQNYLCDVVSHTPKILFRICFLINISSLDSCLKPERKFLKYEFF